MLKNLFPRNTPLSPINCIMCLGENHASQTAATYLSSLILQEIIINNFLRLLWRVEIIYIKHLAACLTPSRCWINGSHMKLSKPIDYIYLHITQTSRELEYSVCTMFLVTYVHYLFKFLQPYKVGIFSEETNMEIKKLNQGHTTNEWPK